MRTQLQVLGWLHFAAHILYVIGGVTVLFLGSAIAAAIGAAGGRDFMPVAALLAASGWVIAAGLLCVGLPGTIIGWGLAQQARWARIPGIVLSVLALPVVPLGTAIGIYGLVVLLNPEAEIQLEHHAITSA